MSIFEIPSPRDFIGILTVQELPVEGDESDETKRRVTHRPRDQAPKNDAGRTRSAARMVNIERRLLKRPLMTSPNTKAIAKKRRSVGIMDCSFIGG